MSLQSVQAIKAKTIFGCINDKTVTDDGDVKAREKRQSVRISSVPDEMDDHQCSDARFT